jgi:hypothetical protein
MTGYPFFHVRQKLCWCATRFELSHEVIDLLLLFPIYSIARSASFHLPRTDSCLPITIHSPVTEPPKKIPDHPDLGHLLQSLGVRSLKPHHSGVSHSSLAVARGLGESVPYVMLPNARISPLIQLPSTTKGSFSFFDPRPFVMSRIHSMHITNPFSKPPGPQSR